MSKEQDLHKEDDYYLNKEIDKESEDYWLDEEEPDAGDEDYYLDEEETDGAYDSEESAESDDGEESDEAYDDTEYDEESDEEYEDEEYEDDFEDDYDEETADEDESDSEEYEEDGEPVDKKSKKTVWIVLGSIFGVLAAAYLGVSIFFMSHFYPNTDINGKDFSAKKVSDVEAYIQEQVAEYSLTVLEKDNKRDSISGEDIDLKYNESKDVEKVLKGQNAFLWPVSFFEKNSKEITVGVSYDKQKLESKIANLAAVKAEQLPPVSAYPKFDGNAFVVEPEVTGTAVDMEALKKKVNQYISEFKPELDMEKEGCYALPPYTSESKEVKAACDTMNNYLKASITYKMGEDVVVDKTVISNWVTVDDKMNVTFNEEAVRAWLTEFGDRFDTVGATRTITSPWGKTVEVSGGTYGWSIDEEAEFTALVNSIKNGEVLEKEPAYYQTAAAHTPQDWGATYAEVDLSGQHMWFIVDGAVALETDVVTGEPIPAKETTAGVFSILEKQLNKTLVGEIQPETGKPEYETPVSFWMRVTWSGIGFHDATWQPAFGGTLYANGLGSHGCINMPYDMASALYNMMPEGTPVIVHY